MQQPEEAWLPSAGKIAILAMALPAAFQINIRVDRRARISHVFPTI
jgi:hypothetical protein